MIATNQGRREELVYSFQFLSRFCRPLVKSFEIDPCVPLVQKAYFSSWSGRVVFVFPFTLMSNYKQQRGNKCVWNTPSELSSGSSPSPFCSLFLSIFQTAEWPLQYRPRLKAAAAAHTEQRRGTALPQLLHTHTHTHGWRRELLLPVCLMFCFALIARLMPFKTFASFHSMQIQLH